MEVLQVVPVTALNFIALTVLYTHCLFSLRCYAVTFLVHNNCPQTIWPGILTAPGSPLLNTSGLRLAPNTHYSFNAPPHWSGRIWARTLCARNHSNLILSCATGDCRTGRISCIRNGGEPPATLVEFTLNGEGDRDFYDISLVDGFNLPVRVTPLGDCNSSSCTADINRVCPPELALNTTDEKVIACKSACLAFQEARYCCTEGYNTPSTCQPSKYSSIFKRHCPQAYSFAYDDSTSTFTCPSGGGYAIIFCPK